MFQLNYRNAAPIYQQICDNLRGMILTGTLAEGERAELFGDSVEQLIDALRSAADVIFADTSCFWGDAVAVAVGVRKSSPEYSGASRSASAATL